MRTERLEELVVGALVLAALLWHACETRAQLPDLGLPCAPQVTEHRRAVLTYEGASGIWFHGDVARCMLTRLEAMPLYVERVRLLEERLSLGDERDALRVRQVALAEEGERRAVEVLDAAVRGRRQAEEALAFERDLRWLWFGVGVVVVVALEALAVWVFSEVAP